MWLIGIVVGAIFGNGWIRVCAAITAIGMGTADANAGSITLADFDSNAVVTDLNNLGLQQANYPAPFTVGIYTLTTDDGQVRYAPFGVSNSFALGNNTDLGFIDITLSCRTRGRGAGKQPDRIVLRYQQ
jgi:hypothetical protein